MKQLHLGKSRLSAALNPIQREELVMNMFGRVLQASLNSSCVKVFVVGRDDRIKGITEAMGGYWIPGSGSDLNSDLVGAIGMIQQEGYSTICIPGDLPFVTFSDIDLVINETNLQECVGLVPSASDGGTNCLSIPKDSSFEPNFGLNSFERHKAQGIEKGVQTWIVDATGMFLDVDTNADLRECEDTEPGFIKRLGLSVDL